MSNQTTQRPTPETDYHAKLYGSGDAVMADFARQLERERDEAMEKIDGLRVAMRRKDASLPTIAEIRDGISGLHSENEAMREVIKNLYYTTETYADGAPDASAHDKLCNEIADKLQPFLKP